jgi:hypothetical protein
VLRLSLVLLVIALAAPCLAADPSLSDTRLRTLGEAGTPRFEVPELIWPVAPGTRA